MKRAKLVLRLPSNSLFNSVTMASRFEIVDEECIEKLKTSAKMKTRRIARSGKRTFPKSG